MIVAPLKEAIDEQTYGGKAAALARALRSDLPVPPGFAISWYGAEKIASGHDTATADALRSFRELGGAVSVRSSAVGEDGTDASFAGQHLTVLNVADEDHFLEAVRAVKASADAQSALDYRKQLDVDGEARIAIVVQKMIDSDVAGVLFTRNPVTAETERLIEAAWGLGEAVVSGAVTPDQYRLDVNGNILERRPGHKDVEIRFGVRGTEEREVAAERVRALSLHDQALLQLHALASKCETAFHSELDLEWAFEGDQLYLLQARPITRVAEPPVVTDRNEVSTLTPQRLGGFALAAILSPLNSTMIAVALPAIGASFGAPAAMLTLWLVSAYLLVSIIAQSPAGKLADIFGYSPVLTAGRFVFIGGALAGAFAPNVTVLAIARVLMAVGGSLNVPPVMAELRNQVAPERRGRLFGLFGALMGTAAAIGPLLGDVLIRRFGWHSVFLVNLPILVLSLVLEPPHHGERSQRKVSFDITGSVLFAVAIALLVGGLQMKSTNGWIAFGAGIVLLFAFVQIEKRAAEPLLDPALFRISAFVSGSSIVALQNFTMYAVLFLVPFLLAHAAGHRVAAGPFLLAMTGAMVLGSPIGGRLADAIGPKVTALAGAFVATAGAVLLVWFGAPSPTILVTALALLGLGIGFSTSPSQAAAASAVSREQAGAAAGALSTMRYLGGVSGSAVVALIVASTGGASMLMWLFPAALLLSAIVSLLLPQHHS